jgi:hypothetical protein
MFPLMPVVVKIEHLYHISLFTSGFSQSRKLNRTVDHWWNDTGRGTLNDPEKNLYHCHFFTHRSHMG